MRLDLQNLLSDDQAVTTGTQLSTNTIDTLGGAYFTSDTLGNTPMNDIGRSPSAEIFCQVTTAFTGGTSVDFQLVQADDAALSVNLQVMQTTGPVAEALLVPGYQPRLALPTGFSKRYFGARYVTVGTHTTGKVKTGIIGRGEAQNAPGTFL